MAPTSLMPHLSAAVDVTAADWRDAIRHTCDGLVAAGAVTSGYVDACVAAIEDHGPYVVIAPGIALAHARPEDGVKQLALAVSVLTEPVPFGHPTNDPVDIVFAFGSPDREGHTGLLASLSRRLLDGLAHQLRTARSTTHATQLLQEVTDDVTG